MPDDARRDRRPYGRAAGHAGDLETARKAGAKTLLITAKDNVRELADEILCIPAKTKVPSDQHAGSLFEQSVLVIGDAVCWYLMQKTGVSTELMNKRHANLQ